MQALSRPVAGGPRAGAATRPGHRSAASGGRPCAPTRRRPSSARGPAPPPAIAAPAPPAPSPAAATDGHTQMLHGLGAVGDVPAKLMPFLLRLAHVR
jgi:hypothetical protein